MNKTRIISRKQAEELLSIRECIPVMKQTLINISEGSIQMLQRGMIHHENGNKLALMPATITSEGITGSKVIIFPGEDTRRAGTNQGIIPIFSTETGALLAIVDGECITIKRTAAASAAATDCLAAKNARTLAVLGAGNQGKAHAEAMAMVRDLEKIYIWDFYGEAAQSAAEYLAESLGIDCIPCRDGAEAVKNADIICTTSKAAEPILLGAWVREGAHINAVGACAGNIREVDGEALKKSLVFADQKEACRRDAGDILIPLHNNEISENIIRGEIGQVLAGKIPGRENDRQITLFETVGLAVQDLAAAWFIYNKAKELGIGTEVEF